MLLNGVMDSTEEKSIQTRQNEDELSMTVVEDGHSSQEGSKDSTHLVDNPFRNNLAKLSVNMKDFCNVRLRFFHNLNEDSILMQNPEFQIKILEENLKFLNKKVSRCSDLQMKNNSCSLNSTSKSSCLGAINLQTSTSASILKEETEFALNLNIVNDKFCASELHNTICTRDSMISPNSNRAHLLISPQNGPLKKHPSSSTPKKALDGSKKSSSKRSSSALRSTTDSVFTPNAIIVESKTPCTETYKNRNDSDNNFEFTVEEEKIVSFVCSPSPPRKQRIQSNTEFIDDHIYDSDQDSDRQSELSSSRGDSLSESVSNMSCKSNCGSNTLMRENYTLDQRQKLSELLWHPPTSQKYVESPSINKQTMNCHSSWNKFPRLHSGEGLVNFQSAGPTVCALTSKNRLKSFLNQEAILFREASLRGCYDIENILKGFRPPLPNVEQDVRRVREEIFSAIRLQRHNDNVVLDSVFSILDICKSWIKLNSHFEREEFKSALEAHGIDISILNDFLQWQSVSRTFIDKIIQALKKFSSEQNTGYSINDHYCNLGSTCLHTQSLDDNRYRLMAQSGNTNNVSSYEVTAPASQNTHTLSKSELVQNKHWKQRRFLSDQSKQGTIDSKNRKLNKSKLTISSSYSGSQFANNFNAEMVFGQGDNGEVCYSAEKYPLTNTSSLKAKGSSNLFVPTQQNSTASKSCERGINLYSVAAKELKEFYSARGESNALPAVYVNNLPSSSTPNVMDLQLNHHCSLNTQSFPTVPPFYNNQFCLVNSNQFQSNLNHCLLKPNPIHCIDTDGSENCIKSSYIKPGSYNPPQKNTTCHKMVNNNISIEDIPLVGIPFLYSSPQNIPQQHKVLNSLNTTTNILAPTDNNGTKTSSISSADDTWRAALTLAESFRESMMTDSKVNDSPNLKLSETVSMKSHFLLSDQVSQNSSNIDFKPDSDTEETIRVDKSLQDINIAVVEAKLKTTDWLVKSFNRAVSENEHERLENKGPKEQSTQQSKLEIAEVNQSTLGGNHQESDTQHKHYPTDVSRTFSNEPRYDNSERIWNENTLTDRFELTNCIHLNNNVITQKKSRKSKKIQDDYIVPFELNPSTVFKKPKSVFKGAITKQVASKLQNILDSIWNTDVSSLVDEELKSQKECTILNFKLRSPLSLQAMRCKLTNLSYDTVEQALSDFQQYFVDIKNKNKGDKQCAVAVHALQQIFLDLVEKHFGIMYQPATQMFGPIGMSPSIKPRRPKKMSRRL